MPVVTETEIPGYVSCRDPLCQGFKQRKTTVTRRAQEFRYIEDLKGDIPGVERTAVDIVHRDDPCPVCDGPQVFSDQERPEYAPISGQDPLALVTHLTQTGMVKDQQIATAQQAAQLAEMKAAMLEMQQELQRRRGGRPPKTEDTSE